MFIIFLLESYYLLISAWPPVHGGEPSAGRGKQTGTATHGEVPLWPAERISTTRKKGPAKKKHVKSISVCVYTIFRIFSQLYLVVRRPSAMQK